MSDGFGIEGMFDKLERMVSTKTVIGDPLDVGGITLIPIMNLSFGFGGGGGSGPSDTGAGHGGGAGARMSVTAMIVIKGDEVTLLPITKRGATIDKLLDAIPDLVDKIKEEKAKRNGEEAKG